MTPVELRNWPRRREETEIEALRVRYPEVDVERVRKERHDAYLAKYAPGLGAGRNPCVASSMSRRILFDFELNGLSYVTRSIASSSILTLSAAVWEQSDDGKRFASVQKIKRPWWKFW